MSLQSSLSSLTGFSKYISVIVTAENFTLRLLFILIFLQASATLDVSRVWLYTLVAADHGGADLMPHFLRHYHDLGIPYNQMLITVHHNPSKYNQSSMDRVHQLCMEFEVYCTTWVGEFSVEGQYHRTLAVLWEHVRDPEDWIVIADSDELQDYEGRSIPEYLESVEHEGATHVTGILMDRVAFEGKIVPIQPNSTLNHQLPLSCKVVKNLYGGADYKITAHKNFLRAGRGNHIIIKPQQAEEFYGPNPPWQLHDLVQWFNVTPYYHYKDKYRSGSGPCHDSGCWDAVKASHQLTIHHFKWHRGVLNNLRDRADTTRGNCILGVNEWNCTPNEAYWREPVKAYAAIQESLRLNLTGMECQEGRLGTATGANSTSAESTFAEVSSAEAESITAGANSASAEPITAVDRSTSDEPNTAEVDSTSAESTIAEVDSAAAEPNTAKATSVAAGPITAGANSAEVEPNTTKLKPNTALANSTSAEPITAEVGSADAESITDGDNSTSAASITAEVNSAPAKPNLAEEVNVENTHHQGDRASSHSAITDALAGEHVSEVENSTLRHWEAHAPESFSLHDQQFPTSFEMERRLQPNHEHFDVRSWKHSRATAVRKEQMLKITSSKSMLSSSQEAQAAHHMTPKYNDCFGAISASGCFADFWIVPGAFLLSLCGVATVLGVWLGRLRSLRASNTKQLQHATYLPCSLLTIDTAVYDRCGGSI